MTEGKKFDEGKPRLELLPPSYWGSRHVSGAEMSGWFYGKGPFPRRLLFDPLPVLEFGAQKYGDYNWHKGMRWSRLVGAFLRHCSSFNTELQIWVPRNLEGIDEESSLMHGQHAECCRLFLVEYIRAGIGENDCPWNTGGAK